MSTTIDGAPGRTPREPDLPALHSLTHAVRRFLQDAGVPFGMPSGEAVGVSGSMDVSMAGDVPAELAASPPLVLGFSGGVDSMVLSHVLARLGVPQILAHLDHGLREGSAVAARAAAAHAVRRGLPFVTERVDVAALGRTEQRGLEDAGRQARYQFLERVRREHGACWIVLGHQADDLVEDVLLRLVRGAGWPALGGMVAVDAARHLLRPLLYTPRAELEACLQALHQSPIEDESNAGLAFRRNRLRHTVVPRLRDENPSLHRSVIRLHRLAALDAEYWDSVLAPLLAQAEVGPHSTAVPETLVRPLQTAVRLRLYTRLLAALGGHQPRAETLFALDKALFEPQRPKLFQFPGAFRAVLGNGRLRFEASPPRPLL